MSNLFLRRSGRRAGLEWVPLLGILILSGCNYGFRGGGGFPSSIETVYVEPFENLTDQFELQDLVYQKLLEQLPRDLGVRPAGREVADAIVRGRILRYEDVAENYRAGGANQGVEVVEYKVRVTIAIEIIDTGRNLILWESSSVIGQGTYLHQSQTYVDGRTKAVDDLAQAIVDGARSQW